MDLKLYRKKRHFDQTPEPRGSDEQEAGPELRYVIQKHAASHLHYDFRLELNGVLVSWAVPKGPCLDPSIKRLAVHVEDHPLEYGDFEGNIPKGHYGAGTVIIWDTGTWVPTDKNPQHAYSKGSLSFILKGKKLKGKWKLVHMFRNPKTWLLIKVKDDYARSLAEYDVTLKKPDSAVSHLSLEDVAKQA